MSLLVALSWDWIYWHVGAFLFILFLIAMIAAALWSWVESNRKKWRRETVPEIHRPTEYHRIANTGPLRPFEQMETPPPSVNLPPVAIEAIEHKHLAAHPKSDATKSKSQVPHSRTAKHRRGGGAASKRKDKSHA